MEENAQRQSGQKIAGSDASLRGLSLDRGFELQISDGFVNEEEADACVRWFNRCMEEVHDKYDKMKTAQKKEHQSILQPRGLSSPSCEAAPRSEIRIQTDDLQLMSIVASSGRMMTNDMLHVLAE